MADAVVETEFDPKRDEEADDVIRKHMGIAMLGGAIPIPLVDLTAVTAVQLDMIKKLAGVYEVEFDPRSSRAFVMSLAGALGGNLVARIGASAVKTIPGLGSLAGGVAQVVLTGAGTYAVGMLVRRSFREKQPLSEVNVRDVTADYEEYVEKGKKVAEEVREETIKKKKRGKSDS